MNECGFEAIVRRQDTVHALVSEAGELLRRRFLARDAKSFQKEGTDFTTEADLESDALIASGLLTAYPQSDFLTEETAPEDYAYFADMDDVWIIDPLDGTTNFSRGNPNFAISVALVDKGVTQLACVYLPMFDRWIEGAVGRGVSSSTLRRGHARTLELSEAVVACDWAYQVTRRERILTSLARIVPHVRAIKSMGCVVADLISFTEGVIDAYIHNGVKPWDLAAVSYFVQQCGGIITDINGDPWNVFSDNLLVGTPFMHPKILNLIRQA